MTASALSTEEARVEPAESSHSWADRAACPTRIMRVRAATGTVTSLRTVVTLVVVVVPPLPCPAAAGLSASSLSSSEPVATVTGLAPCPGPGPAGGLPVAGGLGERLTGQAPGGGGRVPVRASSGRGPGVRVH
jgi:hypothetical protein